MFPSPLDAASYLAHQSKTPSRALNCGLAYALAGDVPSALSHLMAYLEDEPSTEWQVKQRRCLCVESRSLTRPSGRRGEGVRCDWPGLARAT